MLSESKNYQIAALIFRDTQANTKMAKLQLKEPDKDELLNCVMWQDSLEKTHKHILKVGNIIKVKKSDHNEQYNNYILQVIELLEEQKIGITGQEKEDLLAKIIGVAESFSDEKLKAAVLKLIKDNLTLYSNAPAAIKFHHNYLGGLLQHTWECITIAKALFGPLYRDVNRDLVLAGCITHDFGKIFEYILDEDTGAIQTSPEFEKEWINHIHWGFSWANHNGLPELAHIIASHHGLKEWNALVEPQTAEAFLVHYVDNLSSKLGAIEIKDIEKCVQGQLKLI